MARDRERVLERLLPTGEASPANAVPSDDARRVLQAAGAESDQFRHNYVGTEHLIIALADEHTIGPLLA
jgi:ATP-dependent Clp protease ATP-binding subunit ClpA